MTDAVLRADLERLTDGDSLLPQAEAAVYTRAVAAATVIAPPTAGAIAAVLRYCSENGVSVLPAGAGTWLHDPVAALPDRVRPPAGAGPLIVSTARLCTVLEHEPADLVIGVGGGMPLAGISDHLQRHHQMLPLDPPAAGGATIGATIALGAAGPAMAAYGTPRDMVLGLEVVTGDGRLLRFGGRVVKNVAGYDGVRLFTGSRGALGIITAAFLRVRGAPAEGRTLLVPAADAADAARLAHGIAAASNVDASEVVGPTIGSEVWTVLLRLAGSAEAVTAEQDRITRLTGSVQVTVLDAGEAAQRWAGLNTAEAGAQSHVQLQVRPGELAEVLPGFVAVFESAGDRAGGRWQFAAHAANGILRAWCSSGPADAIAADRLVDSVRTFAISCSGTAICTLPGEFGVHTVQRPAPGRAGAALVSSRLADAFDPAAVLRAGARLRYAPSTVAEEVVSV